VTSTEYHANTLLQHVRRCNRRAVRPESIATTSRDGAKVHDPLIIVYAARP